MQRGIATLLSLVLLVGCGCVSAQQNARFQTLSAKVPCFTGVAVLAMRTNTCPTLLSKMRNLSSPFDPEIHLPWDCLDQMAVSVEGCMVSMVSMVTMSETLFNFSCSWLQLQGNLVNQTHARVGAWVRPSSVARYMLQNADLQMVAGDMQAPAPTKPEDWQDRLQDMIKGRAVLIADPARPGYIILSQERGACNTTFEVMSGGVMGVGTVNRSSLGMIVMPSLRPFSGPFIIKGERDRWWVARARAVFIALVVLVSVLGAILMAALGLLAYRLCKAAKARKPMVGSPFDDGIGQMPTHHQDIGHGVSSLENQSRRHGATGGL